MNVHGKSIKVLNCNANKDLAKDIAFNLGIPVGDAQVSTFSNGEIGVSINESIRGADVFVVQSTCTPVNDNLMELLIMIDALKRASAGRINAVMPFYGYARQDRKSKSREPITAKLVANLIEAAGADRVITMDLHAPQIQGFFDIPVDHLYAAPLIVNYFINKKLDDIVVVSPDVGGVTRARSLATKLDTPLAIIDKRRPKPNVSEVMNIIGDIENKNCIIIDDMVDTAGTMVNAAKVMKEMGARDIYVACTHPVLSGPAFERIRDSVIKELIVTNTIPLLAGKPVDKIKVLSVAPLFAEAIKRIYEGLSLSKLFD
ncbi:MAG TPA: ribose-phosphate diphosphokinase [Bacillota bacterium]|nr:ribose-phosphate diphosphokinase [Clostridiaceae bacterium]HNR03852.1 ribose-phosphate diphosphokinase [Bacillota bacterium]HNT03200.1 ribose-phosphate diphosphokinase [Bacillota bacterium]HPA53520.1 ribose-phosphate diphosphokinase [Bacillota bacterium]HPX67851.1 ribose-phosphate diphosphokinase [Bacillota bacterium]